jgi:hypothetical protein
MRLPASIRMRNLHNGCVAATRQVVLACEIPCLTRPQSGSVHAEVTCLGEQVDQQELYEKLQKIEEHSRDALANFPDLARERLRMILALAKYIRVGLEQASPPSQAPLMTQEFAAVAVNDGGDALDSA